MLLKTSLIICQLLIIRADAINFRPFIPARTELCYENHPESHFKAEISTVQGKHFGKQDIAFTHVMESRNLPRQSHLRAAAPSPVRH